MIYKFDDKYLLRTPNKSIDDYLEKDQDGTYKTYKSTEEIKAINNEEIQVIYSNMKNYLSDKRTHTNY